MRNESRNRKEYPRVRIAMIGGGYVGLVSGACFAEFGSEIAVVEVDPVRLKALRSGHMPIYEPGLDRLVAENVEAGRLLFTDDLPAALEGAEAVFIAVSARPAGAAMAMPISATFMPPPNRWRARSRAMR
jgi:UDP-glucose 6-dehydrogenase